MLKDSLFTVHEVISSEAGHTVRVALLPGHPIFRGHFPGNPVVPGVCSIQIVKECAEMILQRGILLSAIDSCKFTAAIVPDDRCLDISLLVAGSKLTATVSRGNETMVKLKANIQLL